MISTHLSSELNLVYLYFHFSMSSYSLVLFLDVSKNCTLRLLAPDKLTLNGPNSC